MKTQRRMRKSIFVFLALAIFVCVFFISQNTKADNNYKGIVKGIFTEKIDDVEYQKEVHYGKSGLFSLDEMAKDLGVEIYGEDKVKTFPDPQLGIGSKIEILRANPVNVIDVKDIQTYRTWTKTVEEFLSEQEIDIGEQDIVDPANNTAIFRDLEIKITRVGYTEMKEHEAIEYKTVYQDDPTLERGLTKVKQSGKTGIKEFTYKIRRENGVEVSKKLINIEIRQEPENKIILQGTKVISYGTGTATWYDWIGGLTAASNSLAYGTLVKVINTANGKSVQVKIVDKGIKGGAIIDLSDQAFSQIANLNQGKIQVRLEKP